MCGTHFIWVYKIIYIGTWTTKVPISAKFCPHVQRLTPEIWNASCIYFYGNFTKYFSWYWAFGTVFRSITLFLFKGGYLSESLSFKCVVIYEQYFVHTESTVYFVYFYSWLYCSFYILFYHIFLSIKYWFIWCVCLIILNLCEFYPYIEVQKCFLNISWFIYNHLYFFVSFIEYQL